MAVAPRNRRVNPRMMRPARGACKRAPDNQCRRPPPSPAARPQTAAVLRAPQAQALTPLSAMPCFCPDRALARPSQAGELSMLPRRPGSALCRIRQPPSPTGIGLDRAFSKSWVTFGAGFMSAPFLCGCRIFTFAIPAGARLRGDVTACGFRVWPVPGNGIRGSVAYPQPTPSGSTCCRTRPQRRCPIDPLPKNRQRRDFRCPPFP